MEMIQNNVCFLYCRNKIYFLLPTSIRFSNLMLKNIVIVFSEQFLCAFWTQQLSGKNYYIRFHWWLAHSKTGHKETDDFVNSLPKRPFTQSSISSFFPHLPAVSRLNSEKTIKLLNFVRPEVFSGAAPTSNYWDRVFSPHQTDML